MYIIIIYRVNASTFCVVCRDFPGPYAGILENEQSSVELSSYLNSNGKPTLSASSSVNANITKLFNTISDVNIELSIFSIDYNVAYHNPTLYQFDGQGYGNQEDEHNFYFTCEIHGEGTAIAENTLQLGTVDESWAYINGKRVIQNNKNGLSLVTSTYTIPNNKNVQIIMFMTQRNNIKSELHFETSTINIIDISDCNEYIQNLTFSVSPTSPTPSPTSPTPSPVSPTPSPVSPTPSPVSPSPSPVPSPQTTIPSSPSSNPSSLPTNSSFQPSNETLSTETKEGSNYGIGYKIIFGTLIALVPIVICSVLYYMYVRKEERRNKMAQLKSDNKTVQLQGYLIE